MVKVRPTTAYAGVAQLAEQLTCNEQVAGSTPIVSFLERRDVMEHLYNRNGLIFWTEDEILAREEIASRLVRTVQVNLREQNPGFGPVGSKHLV